MAFPKRVGPRPCQVKGRSGQASMSMEIRVQLWNRHVRDTVVILEEVKLPHPRFPLCCVLVPLKALNGTHRCTAHYTQGAERKRRQLAAEEEREVTARAFRAYGHPLEMVTSFKYLGRMILATENDWPEVVRNLAK